MTYDSEGDRARQRQRITAAVRDNRRGKSAAQLADELHRGLAAAGVPQPPEIVGLEAAAMAGFPWSLFSLAATGLRTLVRHDAPAGLRAERQELTGTTWVTVRTVDDPSTRATLHRYHGLQHSVPLDDLGHAARLVLLPDDVAVFLGSSYVGVLPPDAALGLRPVVARADAADRRLMVLTSIDRSPGADTPTMAVAVP